jgi:hypothetical protein
MTPAVGAPGFGANPVFRAALPVVGSNRFETASPLCGGEPAIVAKFFLTQTQQVRERCGTAGVDKSAQPGLFHPDLRFTGLMRNRFEIAS